MTASLTSWFDQVVINDTLHGIKAIVVWPWEHAPLNLRALSTHGGDEDGIAYIPSEFLDPKRYGVYGIPWWVERLWDEPITGTDVIKLDSGLGLLVIWAHS